MYGDNRNDNGEWWGSKDSMTWDITDGQIQVYEKYIKTGQAQHIP